MPVLGGNLRRDACALRLVEVVDYGLLAVFNVGPVLARELGHQVHHGAEGSAVSKLVGVPLAFC